MITYACLDYLATADPDSRTATLTRLSADPGSPGRLMKLPQEAIQDALEETARKVADIRLAAPAGITQLVLDAHRHTWPRRCCGCITANGALASHGRPAMSLGRPHGPLTTSQLELASLLEAPRKETYRRSAADETF